MTFGLLSFNIGAILANATGMASFNQAQMRMPRESMAVSAIASTCSGPSSVSTVMLQDRPTGRVARQDAPKPPRSIRRDPDGLFYVDAVVNGAPVRFLIDTGATSIVLTKADAARAGVLPANESFDAKVTTAGGETAMAWVRLDRVTVAGALDWDVPAAVASANLGVSLLGASWLTQIGSMTITGDRMVLN
jgi:clan AA aspartic protease (TIGR02281 family)